jgi:hypothetical protein
MIMDPEEQPLYIPPAERVSLDEIKQRVGTIQDLAVTQAKDVATEVWEKNVTRALIVGVGVVVVAASLAYFLGQQAGRAAGRRVVRVDLD